MMLPLGFIRQPSSSESASLGQKKAFYLLNFLMNFLLVCFKPVTGLSQQEWRSQLNKSSKSGESVRRQIQTFTEEKSRGSILCGKKIRGKRKTCSSCKVQFQQEPLTENCS